MQNMPFISIVVPVRNEEKFISQTLNQIIQQDYPKENIEVLVIDGMSEDNTKKIANEFVCKCDFVKLLDNPKKLSSSGRNLGAKNSRGEIIVFVDGHCYIPDEMWLKNIIDAFEKTGAVCLCRPQPLNPPHISFFQSAVALARNSFLGHGLDSTIYTQKEGWVDPTSSGAMYKREVFEKVGYFDENFDACEDVEFNFRVKKANLKSYISPKLTILYYPRENFRRLFRQMFRYGWGRLKFIHKHKDAFSFGQTVPSLFIVATLVLLSIGLFKSIFLNLFLLWILAYLLTVFFFSLGLSYKNGWKYMLFLPMIYFTIHFGIGLGFLRGFFGRD